jgi:hypothetical protein
LCRETLAHLGGHQLAQVAGGNVRVSVEDSCPVSQANTCGDTNGGPPG